MPSPFPGMDPYLEAADWPDFHLLFLASLRIALNDLLPPPYFAHVEERVNLIEAELPTKLIRPDLAVERAADITAAWSEAKPNDAATAVVAPVTIPLMMYEEVRERRIEIVSRINNELVAVIELLSPWNKSAGTGHSEYLAKRLQIIRQPVHLVEIDLLLGGTRVALSQQLPRGDYYAYVARADHRPYCDVYAWTIKDHLPPIPIPLRSPDGDIIVNLASVFASAYEMGKYDRRLPYSGDPPVSVPKAERSWVAELAKSASSR